MLVVDDTAAVREALVAVLENEPGIAVVGAAADGLEAVSLCLELEPDAVLMDVRMPRADGLEATRAIKAARPQTRIVLVTGAVDAGLAQAARHAGADDLLTKECGGEALREALAG